MYIIYKHTSPNNEVYIGQTKQNIEDRWDDGFGDLNSKTKYAKAILKYGWEQFTHEIIEKDIPTVEEANEREIYWINYYDSYKNGLNSTAGGSGLREGKHIYKIDTETLEALCEYPSLSAAAREYGSNSHYNIQKCCERSLLRAHGFYWCYVEDYSPNWKPINKKLCSSGNERKVIQISPITLEKIHIFDSIVLAAEALDCSAQVISACVRGVQKTAKNFYWCYEEDYPNWKPPRQNQKSSKKQIYQYSLEGELIETYESVASAAKINEYDASHLAKAARQNKKAYNSFWSYELF